MRLSVAPDLVTINSPPRLSTMNNGYGQHQDAGADSQQPVVSFLSSAMRGSKPD